VRRAYPKRPGAVEHIQTFDSMYYLLADGAASSTLVVTYSLALSSCQLVPPFVSNEFHDKSSISTRDAVYLLYSASSFVFIYSNLTPSGFVGQVLTSMAATDKDLRNQHIEDAFRSMSLEQGASYRNRSLSPARHKLVHSISADHSPSPKLRDRSLSPSRTQGRAAGDSPSSRTLSPKVMRKLGHRLSVDASTSPLTRPADDSQPYVRKNQSEDASSLSPAQARRGRTAHQIKSMDRSSRSPSVTDSSRTTTAESKQNETIENSKSSKSQGLDKKLKVEFNNLILQAKELEAQQDLRQAINLYQKANDLVPNDQIIKKLRKLHKLVEVDSDDFGFVVDSSAGVSRLDDVFYLSKNVYDSLLPHQREGLAWLWSVHNAKQSGGILGDDMVRPCDCYPRFEFFLSASVDFHYHDVVMCKF
jgi:hypothetical protein